MVALSFDDGPDLEFTPQILDILKRENVKATFFLLGKRSKMYPHIVQRIVAEGHSIGNHTWDHPILTKSTPQKIRAEIQKTDDVLFKIVGFHTYMFRPPYGEATTANVFQITKMNYKVIDWSVDTRDWIASSPDQILNIVNQTVKPGAIILGHSAGPKQIQHTVNSLPDMIRMLRAKNYKIVTIPELLNMKALEYE
ncbi:polysaccharide deacetylase family protein [Tumebacillus lipolyticus]|uniref:Polysaccharide deacetylase family protein n=1 Tax=Tumebacillus lipolyticus TaxID=1280370 RepID=A0ABW4ZSN8_9BACL